MNVFKHWRHLACCLLMLAPAIEAAAAAPREVSVEAAASGKQTSRARAPGAAAPGLAAPSSATASATPSPMPAPAPGLVEPPRSITMRFHDVALHEVFDILSRQWRVNILLSKGVSGRVTVNLFDVGITQAVQSVAQAAGYAVEMRGNDYVILDRQELGRDVANVNSLIRTYKVQYSNVKQVSEILAKYLSRQGKITMLPERNLLVIEDAADFHERIERLLATLDVEPRQILIEAKILEITLDKSETYGVDWTRVFGANNASSGGTKGLVPRTGGGLVFNLVNNNLSAYLSALSNDGRVKTLSTPRLLALENQEAQAVIGERIGYKVTTTINQVTTESIQFLETGVILKVTPSVDQRGRVLMNIHPEVSSGSITGGIPSKKSTEVTTQLLCEDGQAVFIGGLIKRVNTRRNAGVPGLKDVPALGVLFSNNDESSLSTETVVVITPRIVRSDAERAALIPDSVREAGAPPTAIVSAPAGAPTPTQAAPRSATPASSPTASTISSPSPSPSATRVPATEPAAAAPANPSAPAAPPRRRSASAQDIVSTDLASEDERDWFTRMASQLRRTER